MKTVEEISDYLFTELNYAYCDNCDNYNLTDHECDGCHRKSQNWCLSRNTADWMADKILNN